jgi:hypothetical protein
VAPEWGLGSYFQQQYLLFLQGLRGLRSGDRATLRGGFGRDKDGGAKGGVIIPPRFDDVFKLGTRPPLTRDDWSSFYQWKERGGAAPPPSTIAQIEQSIRTRERLSESTSPDWANSFGQMLTALDNTQDLLSTLALVGRFLLGGLAAAFPALGLPIMLLSGVANVINVLTLLGLLASPLYALVCRGPSAALAAGIPALLFGRGGKGKLGALADGNPFSRGPTGKGPLRVGPLGRGKGALPSAIEGAQVTGDLFGWGLVMGGLVGGIQDAAFGGVQALGGEAPRLKTPRHPERYLELFADVLHFYPLEAIDDLRSAAGVLCRAPLLLRPDSPLTTDERLALLVSYYAAMDLLKPFLFHPRRDEALDLAANDEWTPPVYATLDTLAGMERDVDRADALRARWPMTGAPARVAGDVLADAMFESAVAYHHTLEAPAVDDVGRWVEGAIVARITERWALAGPSSGSPITWRLTDEWALAECLAERGFIIRVTEPPERLAHFFEHYKLGRERSGGTMLSERELRALADATGVLLIPLLPADAPMPDLEAPAGGP